MRAILSVLELMHYTIDQDSPNFNRCFNNVTSGTHLLDSYGVHVSCICGFKYTYNLECRQRNNHKNCMKIDTSKIKQYTKSSRDKRMVTCPECVLRIKQDTIIDELNGDFPLSNENKLYQ